VFSFYQIRNPLNYFTSSEHLSCFTDENATTTSSVSGARHDRYGRSKESGMNPSGKKVYDRNFILNLHDNSASMKKPEGLPNLEIVRDQVIRRKYYALSTS